MVNMKEKTSEILTVQEFAERMKLHPNTVRYHIRSGHILAFKTGNGKKSSYRIFCSEIPRMAAFSSSKMIESIVKKRMEKCT